MVKAVGVPADDDDLVYVDVLRPRQLKIIYNTVHSALKNRREEFWPSTIAGSGAKKTIASGVVPRLVLVPLERLGASQGFSGASVFIGYFKDEGNIYLPSKPVVIKLDDKAKLEQELANSDSWPRHPFSDDGRFAHPFWLSSHGSRAVLVAPFSSEGALNDEGTEWRLRLRDYWTLLTATESLAQNRMARHLNDLYELVHQVHRNGRVKCDVAQVSLWQEYRWYLRGLTRPDATIPENLFGDGAETHLFGEVWPNPARVVRRVLDLPAVDTSCGPIHGDLHPKNVVLDRNLKANVIDFGWARPVGHIAKDYALMEVNLRSMTLPAHIPFAELRALAQSWLIAEEPTVTDGPAAVRQRLIRRCIWPRVAKSVVLRDWNHEYLAPLFLIAFGLLKHLDSARNQLSLILTILSLGRHLSNWLDTMGGYVTSEAVH